MMLKFLVCNMKPNLIYFLENTRQFSLSLKLLERYPGRKKNPHPWHRDFGPHPEDVGPDKVGGSVELAERVSRDRG